MKLDGSIGGQRLTYYGQRCEQFLGFRSEPPQPCQLTAAILQYFIREIECFLQAIAVGVARGPALGGGLKLKHQTLHPWKERVVKLTGDALALRQTFLKPTANSLLNPA